MTPRNRFGPTECPPLDHVLEPPPLRKNILGIFRSSSYCRLRSAPSSLSPHPPGLRSSCCPSAGSLRPSPRRLLRGAFRLVAAFFLLPSYFLPWPPVSRSSLPLSFLLRQEQNEPSFRRPNPANTGCQNLQFASTHAPHLPGHTSDASSPFSSLCSAGDSKSGEQGYSGMPSSMSSSSTASGLRK